MTLGPHLWVGAISLMVLPVSASACAYLGAEGVAFDNRISVGPTCEFEDAEDDDRPGADTLTGKPVVDVGGGKIAQAWNSRGVGGCASAEQLLFVDCNTAETILIDGMPRPHTEMPEGFSATSIRMLQGPEGKIQLRATSSVGDLVAISDREGHSYQTDVAAWQRQVAKAQNRIDPYCGCRLLYPETMGARQ